MAYRNNFDAATAHIDVLEKENHKLREENKTLKEKFKQKPKRPFPWKRIGKVIGYSVLIITLAGLLGWLPYQGITGCIKNDNLALEVCKYKYPGGRGYKMWAAGCNPIVRECIFYKKENGKWSEMPTASIYKFDIEDYLKEKGKGKR